MMLMLGKLFSGEIYPDQDNCLDDAEMSGIQNIQNVHCKTAFRDFQAWPEMWLNASVDGEGNAEFRY